MKLRFIPIMIGAFGAFGAFGTFTKRLMKRMEDLEICGRGETMQTTT